jgi:hypothetical protein
MIGTGFRLETGPQLGFLAGAKVGDSEANDDFNSFDLSWAFGAGYITPSGFGVDARYNLGLTISDRTIQMSKTLCGSLEYSISSGKNNCGLRNFVLYD